MQKVRDMAKVTVKQLVEQANREVVTLTPEHVLDTASAQNIVFVDIRDIRELEREGRIENAIHAPRGMLEFWFDPESPYHREVFGKSDKQYVFFCAAGWRSALAAKSIKDMGFDNIAHIDGGFAALKEAGAPVTTPKPKS